MTDLFHREEQVFKNGEEVLRSETVSLETYESLLNEYKRLLRQSKKLVKLGDSNQNKLMRAQQMMERAMQFHRKKAEIEEKKAKDKSDMMGMLTHDMKNKAAPFSALSEMLRDELPELSEEAEEILDLMTTASESMLSAVDQVLDRESSSGGIADIIPVSEWVDVSGLARSCVRHAQILADKKNIQLEVDLPELYEAYVDPFLIGEVFENLLSNAIKYTPKDGVVQFCFKEIKEENSYRFVVKDNGVGFSPEEENNLFKSYQKLSSKPTDGESSSGLGLSIVHKIVSLHGGHIHGKSEGLGKGAEFVVELQKTLA